MSVCGCVHAPLVLFPFWCLRSSMNCVWCLGGRVCGCLYVCPCPVCPCHACPCHVCPCYACRALCAPAMCSRRAHLCFAGHLFPCAVLWWGAAHPQTRPSHTALGGGPHPSGVGPAFATARCPHACYHVGLGGAWTATLPFWVGGGLARLLWGTATWPVRILWRCGRCAAPVLVVCVLC